MNEKSQDGLENGTWLEIARPGTFKDSSGAAHHFSLKRLEDMAAAYDPAKREAPLVIGHPATDAPAYGWIKALKIKGGRLMALAACVSAKIREAVDNGHYRYLSMSLYPDDGLRHVGLLGANPPAIDGLAPVSFSDEAALIINFSGGSDEPEEEGTQMTPEELNKKLAELEYQLAQLTRERDEARQEAQEAKAALEKSAGEAEKVASEFAAYRDQQEKTLLTGRFDRLVKEGKLTPAERPTAEKTAEVLRQAGLHNFAAEGGENPLELFIGNLEARQPSALCASFSAPPDSETVPADYEPMSAKL